MAVDFAAGCLGGCAGLAVGYPLDTVKVHIQTQNTGNPKFRGTWHCLKCIFVKDSMMGLYRGMSSPMAGVALVNAIVFGIYGQAQKYTKNPDSLTSHFVAGAAAGLAQSPVVSPLELVKTKLQLQSPQNKSYSSPISCLRKIYKSNGILGIFRGFTVTAVREIPGYGLYFFTYELLTRTNSYITINQPISTVHMLMAGGLSGIVSWFFTYPIDVIKSRLQADTVGQYASAVDCLKKSLRDDGIACLYKGLNSTILRAFPTNAATFTVVNWTLRLFGEKNPTFNDNNALNNEKQTNFQRNPTIQEQQHLVFAEYNSLFRSLFHYETTLIQSQCLSNRSYQSFDVNGCKKNSNDE